MFQRFRAVSYAESNYRVARSRDGRPGHHSAMGRGGLVVLFCAQTCAVLAAQTLTAVPSRVLADEAAVIRAAGLEPNERIAIQALLEDGAGNAWASAAEFLADARGVVDTA